MPFGINTAQSLGNTGGAMAQSAGNNTANAGGDVSSGASLNGMDSGISTADMGSLNTSLSSNLSSQGAETNALTNFQEKSSLMQQMGKARGKAIENGAML